MVDYASPTCQRDRDTAPFSELFDTRVCYSGISFVYQFSGILASGFTPIIATALLRQHEGQDWLLAAYLLIVGVISALSRMVPARDCPSGHHETVGAACDGKAERVKLESDCVRRSVACPGPHNPKGTAVSRC